MSAQSIKVGDLVKMNHTSLHHSSFAPGLILDLFTIGSRDQWAEILWTNGYGKGTEKIRDLELVSSRKVK